MGLVLLLHAPTASAVTKTWAGNFLSTGWNTAGNWSPSGVPGIGDDVVVNGASNLNINAAVDVASFSVNSGYTNTISGNAQSIRIRGNLNLASNAGTFTSTSGTLQIDGAFNRTGTMTFNGNGGTILLDASSNKSHAFNGASLANVKIKDNDGLVGWWALDENSGTTSADGSGYGQTGSFVGSPSWTTSVAPVSFSDAAGLSFNGTNAQFSVPDNSRLDITGDITVAFWVYRAANTTDWTRMVGKGATMTARNYGVWMGPSNGYKILWQQYDAGGASVLDLQGSTTIALNTWYHVACTISGSTASVYVNGVLEATGTRLGTPATNSDALTFGYAGFHTYLNGRLDDVRIYDRALSAAEVSTLGAGRIPAFSSVVHSLTNALVTTGDLTILSGTLSNGASNVTVGGSWKNQGGIFTAGSGVVTLNGTAATNVLQTGQYHFNNLTISGSGTWTMGDRLWVDNTLTMTNGTLNQSSSNYTVRAGAINKTGGTLTGGGSLVLTSASASTVTMSSSGIANLRLDSPTDSGLLGYWRLDGDQGTTAVDSGPNGFHGTYTGGVGATTSVSSSVLIDNPGAAAFGGSNGYITVPDSASLQRTGDLTISMWVYRAGATTDWVRLVGKGDSTKRNYGVWYGPGIGYQVLFQQYDGAGGLVMQAQSTTAIPAGAWTHVAVTQTGATGRIYINGVLDGTATRVGTPATSTDPLTFGYAGFHGYHYGSLDEIRMYSRALSAAEIATLAGGRPLGVSGPTFTLANAVSVTGGVYIDNGILDVTAAGCAGASCAITAGGSFVNSGTFTARTGTVTLNGSATTSTIRTNGSQFNNLTVSGTGTWTMAGAVTAAGTYTQSAGTVSMSAGNYNLTAATANKTGGTLTGGGSLILSSASPRNLQLNSAAVSAVQLGTQTTTGLVGYWKLDEASGTSLADSSGSGNTGTLQNGYSWLTTGLPGLQFTDPAGIALDGTAGTYATLNAVNLPANDADQTISVWFKDATPDGGNHNMVALSNSTNSGVQLGLRGAQLIAWQWGGGALAATTAPTDSLWHHVAYTFDGTTHRIYLDGVMSGTSTAVPQTGTVTAAFFGTYTTAGGELYTGKLDDVRVYDRALSASEVSNLAGGRYYDTLNGAAYTQNGAVSTTGDLLIYAGSLDVSAAGCAGASCALTVGGSFTNAGTFTARTGTVTLNGSSTGKTISSNFSHFNNLTISGTGTWTLTDRLWVDGTYTMNAAGTLAADDNNVWVGNASQTAGSLTGTGTLALHSRANVTTNLSGSTISNVRFESTGETNLAGYWKFDEGTGTSVTDWSGNGNTGTLVATPTRTAAVPSAVSFDNYNALSLNGAGDYVTLGVTNLPNNNSAQTVAAWVKLASAGGTQNIIALSNNSSAGLQFGLGGGNVRVWKWGGTDLVTSTAPSTGVWHHIAWTFDGTNNRLYVDGAQTATSTVTIPTNTVTTALIGTYNTTTPGEYFGGQIDDVRVYKQALTATQVAALAAGRYTAVGGGATFTMGTALNVPGTLAVDNGTLSTAGFAVAAATADSSKTTLVNSGSLVLGATTLTANAGIIVQAGSTLTQSSASKVYLGAGKSTSYYDTAGVIEGFPTAAFDWTTFSYWNTYVVFRSFSGTTDRLLARTQDGGTGYFWDLPAGQGSILGAPRWNMESGVHYVYLATTLGYIYKITDSGSAFTTVTNWPYRNGTSATATAPLITDANNMYWAGRDGTGTRKIFSLTLGRVLNNTQNLGADVVAAPTLATVSSTSYLFLATSSTLYRMARDASAETTGAPGFTSSVGGHITTFGSTLYMSEDNGKVWSINGASIGSSNWSYQDTNATRHPGGCTAASQCTVKNVFYDWPSNQVIFGDNDGHVYSVGSGGALATGYPWRPGTSADSFQTAPIVLPAWGVVVIGAANGNVYFFDRSTGTGPALIRTVTLPGAPSTMAFNASANGGSGVIMVGTADGKLFYLAPEGDPTASVR